MEIAEVLGWAWKLIAAIGVAVAAIGGALWTQHRADVKMYVSLIEKYSKDAESMIAAVNALTSRVDAIEQNMRQP